MTYEVFFKGVFPFFVALVLSIALLATSPAAAAEHDQDTAVRKVLIERTDKFCKEVLPVWFSSERGIDDPDVKTVVADCYMGHARLAILGMGNELSIEETSLSEVPAVLLRMETGMNLDIYRPLAGRTIRIRGKEY